MSCSVSDIYFVADNERSVRFQVASLSAASSGATTTPSSVAPQGHSGKAQAQMESRLAHGPILHAGDTPLVFHATRSTVLKRIRPLYTSDAADE